MKCDDGHEFLVTELRSLVERRNAELEATRRDLEAAEQVIDTLVQAAEFGRRALESFKADDLPEYSPECFDEAIQPLADALAMAKARR
jgi:hypothetical protein